MDMQALMQMLMQAGGMGGMGPPQSQLPVMPQMQAMQPPPGMGIPMPFQMPGMPQQTPLFTLPPKPVVPAVAPPVTAPTKRTPRTDDLTRGGNGGGARGASSGGNGNGFGGH